jgi:arylsulfatase A
MIPTLLKKAGYVTASVGKWGQMSHGPGEWGFDEYLVFPGSGRYWRAQTTHYTVNGVQKNLPARTYLPELMHDFLIDFLRRHQDQPFFVYYPMSHIHGPIVRTPDSRVGNRGEFYADNIAYMDKLVGKLLDELERLHLREKTLVIFTGDNGTARFGVEAATINGRAISGQKGTMLEGGSRVPCLVSWPGTTPAGQVNRDLHDFSDFFVTFAELADAKLPTGVTLDGHSFAAPLMGQAGKPREWAYVELNGRRYVRDARWKLMGAGQLFDLKDAPYVEAAVSGDSTNAEAATARGHLRAILDGLVKGRTGERPPPAGESATRKE